MSSTRCFGTLELKNKIAVGFIIAFTALAVGSCSETGMPGANGQVNRPPRITSTPVTRVEENADYRYQVEATDENGDELTYSLNNNPPWLSVDRQGLVQGRAPEVDDDERVSVEVVVSDGSASVSQPYELFIRDVDEPIDPNATTIRGTLQDSETDAGSEGEVRAYKQNGDGTYTLLDSDRTDADGNFTLSFSESVSEFDLQARLKDGEVDAGFVRTVTLPGESKSDYLVRSVPYTNLNGNMLQCVFVGDCTFRQIQTDVTHQQFREFIIDTMDGGGGIHKWDLDRLQGIEVIDENPTNDTAYFTQEELDHIDEVLTDPEDGRVYFNGKEVPVQIDSPSTPDSEKHYDIYDIEPTFGRRRIEPHDGWIVIVPQVDWDAFGSAWTGIDHETGYFSRGRISLETNEDTEYGDFMDSPNTLSHELGHVGFYTRGAEIGSHTFDLRESQSVTSLSSLYGEETCTKPCEMDKKAAKLVYEDTFPTKTRADDVLGLEFHD